MADGPDLQSTFVRRAEQAGTRVTLVSPHDLFASIAGAIDSPAAGVGVTSEVIAAHPAIAKLASRGKQHPETAVALAPLGIAETGSVALAERDRADRLLGLLCRRQIVVLERRALVPALAGAMPSLAGWISDGRPYVTFVTGPSRTSDIERILTIGVHGPAELTVLLLQ
ncbi:MAG: LUD domain-containing protein [Chloroflexota bacterium]